MALHFKNLHQSFDENLKIMDHDVKLRRRLIHRLMNPFFINTSIKGCHMNKINLTKTHYTVSAVSLLAMFILGCGESNEPQIPIADTPLAQVAKSEARNVRAAIEGLNLVGDPSVGRRLPNINDPKAQLGMKLFFTKGLGGDFDSACVSCHHPVLGGGDDLSLPIGVDADSPNLLGPGRFHTTNGEHFDGGPTVPRNAPTTFNIAMWDKVLFHDGRLESLGGTSGRSGADGLGIRTPDSPFGEADSHAGATLAIAQARFPVTSAEEMKNFNHFSGLNNNEVRSNLAQRIGDYGDPLGGLMTINRWLVEFQKGFNNPQGTAEELITFSNITEAIGDYEHSQVFVDTPWKAFVEGDDDALSLGAKRGAQLFFNSVEKGGANCASCHSGDFFTDEKFYVIAMPQIGRGKGNGPFGNDDFGRYRETGLDADKYAFRTPSLLNTTATGPWGHAGAYTSLIDVITHHLDPQQAIDKYNYSQIDPSIQAVDMLKNTQHALDQLAANAAAGSKSLEAISLTDLQVNNLAEFLLALTDPCVEDRECLSEWIPDASDPNPDALRINGVDDNGNFL
ncbi:MAG: cytochrome c peroxidase [Paraglaciecola sp.]